MRQATVLRVLIVGLPIGLMTIGFASLVVHYMKPSRTEIAERQRAGKAIDEKDLRHFVKTFVEIGPRHTGKPKGLEIGSKFIESSLGTFNMGYDVRRRNLVSGDQTRVAYEVERRGKTLPNEVILVAASYDTLPTPIGANRNASSLAVLFTVANALFDAELKRTVRFMVWPGEASGAESSSELAALDLEATRQRTGEIVGMICLERLAGIEISTPIQANLASHFPGEGRFLVLAGRPDAAAFIRQAGSLIGSLPLDPVHQCVLNEDVSELHDFDHKPFQKRGIPALLMTDRSTFQEGAESEESALSVVDFPLLKKRAEGLERLLRGLADKGIEATR